jgi:predicted regulator of Ras-like GTPase activity (Roadblock/LC7/MglB family)
MSEQQASGTTSRSARLDSVLTDLLSQAPEVEAAAVVSFDGLPMASLLPEGMDEDRVAAMSAALLSLGERAAQGLGRGDLTQVYVEGEHGTVFLVSADDEAVLVAVGARGAKVGLVLFEVRRAAAAVGQALRDEEAAIDDLTPLSALAAPQFTQDADVRDEDDDEADQRPSRRGVNGWTSYSSGTAAEQRTPW